MKLYENDDIYVRPFTKDDMKEPYINWFYDSEVTRFNSHGLFPYTDKQKSDFVKSLNTDIVWAIMAKTKVTATVNGKFVGEGPFYIHIGNICLQSINWIHRSAEFAVVIGNKDYWKKGICTVAACWLFEHGFNKLGLHRIFTGTASVNLGMQKVIKKLRMKHEGTFREATYLNGQHVNVLVYGILKTEFKINNS